MTHSISRSATILSLAFIAALTSLSAATAPLITSDSKTTFTIGQRCPETVLIGVDDTPVEVGTPCPFIITTSGNPVPAIALGGQALPGGVYFFDNGDGTATLGGTPANGTAGDYALTFTATNSAGSSPVQNFTLHINRPPVLQSPPMATPFPAAPGQAVNFFIAATDADNDPLSYIWNFGEGANGTGPTATHVYNAPGTYLVYIVVTDTWNAFVYDQVFVTVSGNGTPGGGGNEDRSVVGAGPDFDGDGFSDAFESAVGTDPTDDTDTPTGKPITAGTLQPLTLSRPSIKLNFAQPASDSISFSGTVAVPAGFTPNGSKIYVDVGGVAKVLMLNAEGSATNGSDFVKIEIKTKNGAVLAQTAKYSVSFKNEDFSATLAGAGLTNSNTKSTIPVKFTFIFNNAVLQKSASLKYTAKMGRFGIAK